MILYLAGGVSGNLHPAWSNMARSNDITERGFIEALGNATFWRGGESRHWVQDAASPDKENEGISGQYNQNRGGVIKTLFPNNNEAVSLHGQRNILRLGDKRPFENRGGPEQVNEVIPRKSSLASKVQERQRVRSESHRGGL